MAILPSHGRPNTTLMRKKLTANGAGTRPYIVLDITNFWNVSYGMFSSGNERYKHHNMIKATQ